MPGTNPDWPETLFARAAHRALERILTYVGDPWLSEEADAASVALDAAAYASDHPGRVLIVERLRQMLHDIDIIRDYEPFNEAKAAARWCEQRRESPVWTDNSLSSLVAYVEQGDPRSLHRADASLHSAEGGRPPGSSRRARDEGYLIDHLRRLLEDLEHGDAGNSG